MDPYSVSALVKSITGMLVWVVANVVYFDKKHRGVKGLARFFAFWFGLPLTFLTNILVREGEEGRIRPPPDDEEELLREVRRDRALRDGSDESD